MFTVWPSWLAAVPRITARIRSPSLSASGRRLSNTTTQPRQDTNPSAATSNAWQRPVGDSMPCRRPGDELPRFQHHEGATRQGKVAFAVVQAATGHVHREQAGRTCGVHRQRGTVEPQRVGDPPGRQAEAVAGEAVRPLHGVRIGGQQLVVDMRQSHEHAGQRVGHATPG